MTQTHALLKMTEAADELRISRSKVYRMVVDGTIPYVRITGSIRIPRAALEEYIAAHTVLPKVTP
jgi:excisionase family DNA binding protein